MSESASARAPDSTLNSPTDPSASQAGQKSTDWFAVAARWILGAVFIYMGWQKIQDPVAFLKLVRQYDLTTTPMVLNVIAATLPWFEMFCGALLVLGVAVRGAALVVLGMLIPFTIMVFLRARGIAGSENIVFCSVKFDCGCGAGEVVICHKLLENAAMMLVAAWLATKRSARACLKYQLFGAL